jgi:hypothetical protein
MSDWHTCDVCEAEYKVVTALNSIPQYCPLCGTEVSDVEESDDWSREYSEDDELLEDEE